MRFIETAPVLIEIYIGKKQWPTINIYWAFIVPQSLLNSEAISGNINILLWNTSSWIICILWVCEQRKSLICRGNRLICLKILVDIWKYWDKNGWTPHIESTNSQHEFKNCWTHLHVALCICDPYFRATRLWIALNVTIAQNFSRRAFVCFPRNWIFFQS